MDARTAGVDGSSDEAATFSSAFSRKQALQRGRLGLGLRMPCLHRGRLGRQSGQRSFCLACFQIEEAVVMHGSRLHRYLFTPCLQSPLPQAASPHLQALLNFDVRG